MVSVVRTVVPESPTPHMHWFCNHSIVFSHCRNNANNLNNKPVWWSSGRGFAIISTSVFWKVQFQVFWEPAIDNWEYLRIQCVFPGYCDQAMKEELTFHAQDYLPDSHCVSCIKYIKYCKNLPKLTRLFYACEN